MENPGYALFDTSIGRCALAWNAAGITAVYLPETDEGRLRDRIRRRSPAAEEGGAPPVIAAVIVDIVALLSGARRDLASAPLDMSGVPGFNRRAYALARAIPPGETATYGQIAERMGDAGAARAVGAAMGANPFPIIVPCHRVVAANGAVGGFSAPGGAATKVKMLAIEGARLGPAPSLFPDLALAVKSRTP
ncbi:MAG: methylated-DNA--[protein]-cysteine S-methyltransferase [Caulobacteraceae bacterium]